MEEMLPDTVYVPALVTVETAELNVLVVRSLAALVAEAALADDKAVVYVTDKEVRRAAAAEAETEQPVDQVLEEAV